MKYPSVEHSHRETEPRGKTKPFNRLQRKGKFKLQLDFNGQNIEINKK